MSRYDRMLCVLCTLAVALLGALMAANLTR